jgi:hypothetical protein
MLLATAASDTVKVARLVETSVLPALKNAQAETSPSSSPSAPSRPISSEMDSLRAGHATAAAIAGASERSIMKQTGHRSVQMVRRYIRDGNLFRENSAGKLGL